MTWAPDGSLAVVDFGIIHFTKKGMNAVPGSGVVWGVRRVNPTAAR